ncbi:MAG: rhomboid family intramembrane serine protease, partial [Oligoflexia bacterium]|nr:rhomboid family intramembrane serine protease [Oligoflexia bacterium]
GKMPDYMREATGASSGVYGLMLAFFLIYGRKPVLLNKIGINIFRLKYIKLFYFFPFLLIPEILGLIKMIKNGMNSAIGYEAHLGGMLFGLVFLLLWKFFQKNSEVKVSE